MGLVGLVELRSSTLFLGTHKEESACGGSGEAARAAPQARPGVGVDSLTLTLKRTVGGAKISRPRCLPLRPVRASNWICSQRGIHIEPHP